MLFSSAIQGVPGTLSTLAAQARVPSFPAHAAMGIRPPRGRNSRTRCLCIPLVGGIERGERNIGLDNIHRVADALGVSTAELFTRFDEKPTEQAAGIRA